MSKKFKVGNHVGWNAEEGHASGKIKKVHTQDFVHEGYTYHASEENPQYEIDTDEVVLIAAHNGGGLEIIL